MKIDFEYYDEYAFWQEEMLEYYKQVCKHMKIVDSKALEASYLHRNVELQHDERDRLCVLLPLIRLEIEKSELGLTDMALEELEIYYEDYNKGKYDNLFTAEEHELVREDLFFAYEHKNDNLYNK